MPAGFQRITPFFWFDSQAEAAVRQYLAIFPNARLSAVTRYSDAAARASGRTPGSVMTMSFELDGQSLIAINGGPLFELNGSVSMVINCRDQAEVDHYWHHLSQGADPAFQRCGWLRDRFGVTWQVVPLELASLMQQSDPEKAARVAAVMRQMRKLDLAILRAAAT